MALAPRSRPGPPRSRARHSPGDSPLQACCRRIQNQAALRRFARVIQLRPAQNQDVHPIRVAMPRNPRAWRKSAAALPCTRSRSSALISTPSRNGCPSKRSWSAPRPHSFASMRTCVGGSLLLTRSPPERRPRLRQRHRATRAQKPRRSSCFSAVPGSFQGAGEEHRWRTRAWSKAWTARAGSCHLVVALPR
jgi:hypothetical protein